MEHLHVHNCSCKHCYVTAIVMGLVTIGGGGSTYSIRYILRTVKCIFFIFFSVFTPRKYSFRKYFYIFICTSSNSVTKKVCVCIYKGKSIQLQAWSGPEGSRKLRFPDFVTTAQDGGKVVSLTHRPPLPPGNTQFC